MVNYLLDLVDGMAVCRGDTVRLGHGGDDGDGAIGSPGHFVQCEGEAGGFAGEVLIVDLDAGELGIPAGRWSCWVP